MLAELPSDLEENLTVDDEVDDNIRETLEDVLALFDEGELIHESLPGAELGCRKCSARGVGLLDPCPAVTDTGIHDTALWIDGKIDESIQVTVSSRGYCVVSVPGGGDLKDEDMVKRSKETEEGPHNPGAWPAAEKAADRPVMGSRRFCEKRPQDFLVSGPGEEAPDPCEQCEREHGCETGPAWVAAPGAAAFRGPTA